LGQPNLRGKIKIIKNNFTLASCLAITTIFNANLLNGDKKSITNLLQQAYAVVLRLPEDEQNEIAELIFNVSC
jgi:hypothetical protein